MEFSILDFGFSILDWGQGKEFYPENAEERLCGGFQTSGKRFAISNCKFGNHKKDQIRWHQKTINH